MKKLCFIYTGSRKARVPYVQDGSEPADFFYGALEYRKAGWPVELLEVAEIRQKRRAIVRFLNKFTCLFGIDLLLVLDLLNKDTKNLLRRQDVLIATTNSISSSLALLKYFKVLKSEIVVMSMCLIMDGDNWLKKYLYRKIFFVTHLTVENLHEQAVLEEFFAGRKIIHYVPFGVDENFWSPAAGVIDSEDYVLSIGNDAMRDYDTLISAWRPEYPHLKIVTSIKISATLPGNIELVEGDWKKGLLSEESIRALIRGGKFVIIPVKESLRSSGQSVCMRAMSCGKAVLMSRTRGLWDKDRMKHQDNCFLVEPGSAEAMQREVESLLREPVALERVGRNARETVTRFYTINNLVTNLKRVLEYV